MAEIQGLAISVGGLARLFTETIDLFDLNPADLPSPHLDFGVLVTRLNVEKIRLGLWGERIRLMSLDYDVRLNEDRTRLTIFRSLHRISQLLSNGNGWPITTRSVLHDKGQFGNLVRAVEILVKAIQSSLPIKAIDDDSNLSLDHSQTTATDHPNLLNAFLPISLDSSNSNFDPELAHYSHTEETKDHTKELQNRVLERLWSSNLNNRLENIGLAYGQTLEWALENFPLADPEWGINLAAWLRSESSTIYWITGGAGSGKSTLMKHIYTSSKTRTHLSEWAIGEGYQLCHHFFDAVSLRENGLVGIMRHLLWQLLSIYGVKWGGKWGLLYRVYKLVVKIHKQ